MTTHFSRAIVELSESSWLPSWTSAKTFLHSRSSEIEIVLSVAAENNATESFLMVCVMNELLYVYLYLINCGC